MGDMVHRDSYPFPIWETCIKYQGKLSEAMKNNHEALELSRIIV